MSLALPNHAKLFVGGLNWETTNEGLKKHFERWGKVLEGTMPRKGDGYDIPDLSSMNS